jgi:SAM-dependent methyltransferase
VLGAAYAPGSWNATIVATLPKVLDLGCGTRKRSGAVGVDFNRTTDADVIHDLNVFPYPFEDESFDEVLLDNTLEHLDDVVRVVEEVHRICRRGGIVTIIVPYFRSVWACIDPTHKHFFTVGSLDYFYPDHPTSGRYRYSSVRFKAEQIVFNEALTSSWFKRLILKLANRWPRGYEYYLSHFYPLDDITFRLRRL